MCSLRLCSSGCSAQRGSSSWKCTQAIPHLAAWLHRNPWTRLGTGSGAFLSAHQHWQPSPKRMVWKLREEIYREHRLKITTQTPIQQIEHKFLNKNFSSLSSSVPAFLHGSESSDAQKKGRMCNNPGQFPLCSWGVCSVTVPVVQKEHLGLDNTSLRHRAAAGNYAVYKHTHIWETTNSLIIFFCNSNWQWTPALIFLPVWTLQQAFKKCRIPLHNVIFPDWLLQK